VISDLGKVILLFDNSVFFQKLARYCPYSAHDIAERIHWRKDMIRSFDTGEIGPADFFRAVSHILEAKIEQDTFFRFYNDVFSVNPTVLGFLKRLKIHNKMILLSNTDVERFGFIKKKFPEIFLFDDYVLSFEVGYRKPQPEIYMEAIKKARVRAEECVLLDDLLENVEGAQKLGMNAILYGLQTDLETEMKQLKVAI
jgi:putative hydrolase of the HAD superfamily